MSIIITGLTGSDMAEETRDALVVEMGYLKAAQQEQAIQLRELRALVDSKLDRVFERVDNLGLVRKDVYVSEIGALSKRLESAHSLALAAISLSITVVMAFVGYLVLVNK